MKVLLSEKSSHKKSFVQPCNSEVPPPEVIRLLHAEDEPDDALLCQFQLQEAGLRIQSDSVASREEFLAALRSKPYDIVLTDYKLPGWSGLEVLRTLQTDGHDIPCILVTGSVGEEIAAKCMKLGANDYILKDRPARLPFAITSALEERRERARRRAAEGSRNLLAAIVESSLDAIIAASADGKIVNWNPGAERMFGFSTEEVLGCPIAGLFVEQDATAGSILTGAISPGPKDVLTIERFESRGTKKDGTLMDLAVTISPILDSAGDAAGISAIVRDITETKRQQKELLTTQKLEAIGHLAGGVAHDFNNLLTVINGYARMLVRKGSADPAKLEAILQAGERGQRLTKRLLMFSRKQISQDVPLNLNSLILSFMDILRPLIGADIELRTVFAPDLAPVMADAGQMEQVIMNLVVNARDAMPDGGIITISTANLPESRVLVSVTDTGVGMTAEVQSHIFEPFFTTKDAGRGTGLGLSTSYGIVARCNGHLRVASKPGEGTSFTIELPACDAVTAEPAKTACVDNAVRQSSETILLAEDDPTVRGYVCSVLQERGYQVLEAENGRRALEMCTNFAGTIHALVTDVVMPEMNGRTLAQHARSLRPDLKVLFVSGYVDKGLKDEDLSSPWSAFLQKPFTGDALLKAIEEFCAPAA